VTGRLIDPSGNRARVELGEGIIGTCKMGSEGAEEEKSPVADAADLSSLSSLLAAKWKGGGAGSKREPARSGQIRSFRIVKLDQAQKKIELELA
jgi:small subunit ribosomal protein S1